MFKVVSLTVLLSVTFVVAGLAQPKGLAKLDAYFDVLESNNKVMGSVAVSRSGTLLYTRSVGYKDLENKLRADQNSIYRIGSISKTFTTVLVLKAVEEKKLNLDQAIKVFFPGIRYSDQITIGHLLSHRSGIHNFTDEADYLDWNTVPKSELELLAIIEKAGSDFLPGERAAYSNSNFVLLSYILEKTYKQPYASILQDRLLTPIGLIHTYYGGKINPLKNECKSYRMQGTWQLESETDSSIPLGAGGIVSTATDLNKFSGALFGGQLVSPQSLNLMRTMQEGFGMGLFQMPFYDQVGYGHTGGIDGFSSIFAYFPDGEIAYALTTNGTNMNNNDIAIAVLSAVYDKEFDLPEVTRFEVNSADLDPYLGVYVSSQLPLKITITKDNITLIAQATGQSAFPLEGTSKDKFKFEQAGIVMEFNPTEKRLLLKQGGGQFMFTKE